MKTTITERYVMRYRTSCTTVHYRKSSRQVIWLYSFDTMMGEHSFELRFGLSKGWSYRVGQEWIYLTSQEGLKKLLTFLERED